MAMRLPLLLLLIAPTCLMGLERPTWFTAQEPCPAPPPHVLSLAGLAPQDVEKLKTVPGVSGVEALDRRVKLTWQPWRDGESWTDGKKWIKGSEGIYDYLVLKGRLGHTKWTHGGLGLLPPTIIPWSISAAEFDVHFDDDTVGSSCTMMIIGYASAQPGQIVHELVRGMIGRRYEVMRCGDANIIRSTSQYGVQVLWQISDTWYARFSESYDKDMIAAYVHRLGSVTRQDFTYDFDQWVADEIVGRFDLIDFSQTTPAKDSDPLKQHLAQKALDLCLFQDLRKRFGMLKPDAPLLEKWTWFNQARRFLWANRKNFRIDRDEWYLELRGPDLYEVDHPPELPSELQDPPKPEAASDPESASHADR